MNLTDLQWRGVVTLLYKLVAADSSTRVQVTEAIRDIERANGVKTYVVVVRWLDGAHPHPLAKAENPQTWPPELKETLTSNVPITQQVIRDFVATKTADPIAIHVTRDPAGNVGWTKLENWG